LYPEFLFPLVFVFLLITGYCPPDNEITDHDYDWPAKQGQYGCCNHKFRFLIDMRFIFHFPGIDFFVVDRSPGNEYIGKYNRDQQRNITHRSQGVFARRAVVNRKRALEIIGRRIIRGIIEPGQGKQRKDNENRTYAGKPNAGSGGLQN
jgi:hypothetical protein